MFRRQYDQKDIHSHFISAMLRLEGLAEEFQQHPQSGACVSIRMRYCANWLEELIK
jgi:hypothetical protein